MCNKLGAKPILVYIPMHPNASRHFLRRYVYIIYIYVCISKYKMMKVDIYIYTFYAELLMMYLMSLPLTPTFYLRADDIIRRILFIYIHCIYHSISTQTSSHSLSLCDCSATAEWLTTIPGRRYLHDPAQHHGQSGWSMASHGGFFLSGRRELSSDLPGFWSKTA